MPIVADPEFDKVPPVAVNVWMLFAHVVALVGEIVNADGNGLTVTVIVCVVEHKDPDDCDAVKV